MITLKSRTHRKMLQMEEEIIEPKWVQLSHKHDGYTTILYSEDDEVIETHHFGQDLLGAVIRAQQLQKRVLTGNPNRCYVYISGFPNKHPNQTTLDDLQVFQESWPVVKTASR